MTKNYHAYTWRHGEISKRNHEILLHLAAGHSNEAICQRFNLKPAELQTTITYLQDTYRAANVRMLIAIALMDNEINLIEVLPHVIALMNRNLNTQSLDD